VETYLTENAYYNASLKLSQGAPFWVIKRALSLACFNLAIERINERQDQYLFVLTRAAERGATYREVKDELGIRGF